MILILDNHYFKCSCSDSLYGLGDIKKALIHFKEDQSLHDGSHILGEARDLELHSFDLNQLVTSTLYSFFVLEDYDLEHLNREIERKLEEAAVA